MKKEIIYRTKDGVRVRKMESGNGSGYTSNRLPIRMPLGDVLVQRVKDGHLFYTSPESLTEEK